MRDNTFLKKRLNHYTNNYFSDIQIKNNLTIQFGRKAKRQLGSIKQRPDGSSHITITSFFKELEIPVFVIDETIVHEFIHYTHGFNSPLPQKYKHPHKHGIIRKEFKERDLIELHLQAKKWLKNEWQPFLLKQGVKPQTRKRRQTKKQPKNLLQLIEHFLINN